ncbi:MAG TPA: peptidoglycan bridge formation glycyltransferase FemA/FemB family protein [Anaerolineales bacterium]
MPAVSLEEWQGFARAHPGLHLLQTAEWGELKSGFGWTPVRLVQGNAGVQILFRKLPLGLTVAYIPKAATLEGLGDEIESACRARRTVFCKWEPDGWESGPVPSVPPGFVRSKNNIQPPRTLVVDLRGGEEDILARMKQKTRYNIRLAAKKGLTVRPWADLDAFHRMILSTGERDRFGVHALKYYRRAYDLFQPAGLAELLMAEYEGRPLAALMVFAHGPRAWYVYGASTDEERSRMPTYLLQWEAMRWARAHGCAEYDLWGVPDEDEAALEAGFESRGDGLWGVYRFKRGFGGELRRAHQALDRVFNPALYRLYERLQGSV